VIKPCVTRLSHELIGFVRRVWWQFWWLSVCVSLCACVTAARDKWRWLNLSCQWTCMSTRHDTTRAVHTVRPLCCCCCCCCTRDEDATRYHDNGITALRIWDVMCLTGGVHSHQFIYDFGLLHVAIYLSLCVWFTPTRPIRCSQQSYCLCVRHVRPSNASFT